MSSLSTNVTKLESQCVFLELLNREKCLYLAPVISSSQNALSKIKFPISFLARHQAPICKG